MSTLVATVIVVVAAAVVLVADDGGHIHLHIHIHVHFDVDINVFAVGDVSEKSETWFIQLGLLSPFTALPVMID